MKSLFEVDCKKHHIVHAFTMDSESFDVKKEEEVENVGQWIESKIRSVQLPLALDYFS